MFIDKNEVLRYLGYYNQELDDNLNLLIEQCIKETYELVDFKYVTKLFLLERHNFSIKLQKTLIELKGESIVEHLKYSSKCAIMAVTIGNRIETKLRYYQKSNLTKALILDACATTAVEWCCDEVEKELRIQASIEGFTLTGRFSPGYGDFDIKIQSQLLSVLEAQTRIGLTCTENHILLPRKSVTALLGLQVSKDITRKDKCKDCTKFDTCSFKMRGNNCG